MSDSEFVDCDVLLIGAGVMSATVGVLLKELDPSLRLVALERLDSVAGESSDARNNAGTGHSALCELNYTSPNPDGTVDIKKALKIIEQFEVSKQLWAHLVKKGAFPSPAPFVHSVPHVSFVSGEADVAFLRARFEALRQCPLFVGMKFSESHDELQQWMPLILRGRPRETPSAATWSALGTDVNFGELTRGIFDYLVKNGLDLRLGHEVASLRRDETGGWLAKVDDQLTVRAKFVFIGAGGGALELLDSSDIPEAEGYGGFPVGGEWMVCENPVLVEQHFAKVYGKAKIGTPPMSVPHLDSRFLDGRRALYFGPFARFSTKFLKDGSYLDMPRSFTRENLLPMLSAGIRNVGLTRYLVEQVLLSFDDKLEVLREMVPSAEPTDWTLAPAGQRVQVIKKDEDGGGRIEFGTEIISCADNTIAALLGASPGASTAASIAIDLLLDCFPAEMATPAWQARLVEIIPSYGQSLAKDPALAARIRASTHPALGLQLPPMRLG